MCQRVELADIHQQEVVFGEAFDAVGGACLQVEVDDAEAVGELLHQRQHTGREGVYAGESVHTTSLMVEVGVRTLHFARGDIGPTDEAHRVVEEQIALRLALTHEEQRVGSVS